MKIELKADYRGTLTGERFYSAGVLEVGADISEDDALALVAGGRAVEVVTVAAAGRATADEKPAARVAKKGAGGRL